MKVRVWDTMGMEIGKSVVIEDIERMLDGHFKNGYKACTLVSIVLLIRDFNISFHFFNYRCNYSNDTILK